jgi:hypothetical protein
VNLYWIWLYWIACDVTCKLLEGQLDCLPVEKNEDCRWGLMRPQVGVGGLNRGLWTLNYGHSKGRGNRSKVTRCPRLQARWSVTSIEPMDTCLDHESLDHAPPLYITSLSILWEHTTHNQFYNCYAFLLFFVIKMYMFYGCSCNSLQDVTLSS